MKNRLPLTLLLCLAAMVLPPSIAAAQEAAPTEAGAKPAAAETSAPKTGPWVWKGPKTGNEHHVHVPEGYDASRPCPILVMSHGVGSSGAGMIREATCRMAVSRGWIAVAPTWRYEGHTELDSAAVTDELVELIKMLLADYNIDRRLIVSSGFSGGGGVSIRSFTKYPDLYTVLASQSSNFFGASASATRPAAADKRPVLVVWGQNDHPLILAEGPRERDHFTRKGNPTDWYVVPGGRHQTFPNQTWAWLDAIVVTLQADRLSEALKAAGRLRSAGGEPKVAELLRPFQKLEEPKEKDAEHEDPFIKQWNGRHNEKMKSLAADLPKARELYDKAVAEGRRQLAETGARFSTSGKPEHVRWIRGFLTRWAAVPELCAEALASYETVQGEKFPELPKR